MLIPVQQLFGPIFSGCTHTHTNESISFILIANDNKKKIQISTHCYMHTLCPLKTSDSVTVNVSFNNAEQAH